MMPILTVRFRNINKKQENIKPHILKSAQTEVITK